MTRLLDLDMALSLMRGNRRVAARASQHVGDLNPRTPSRFVSLYSTFMRQFQVRDATRRICAEAARLTRYLPAAIRTRSVVDAILAATALEHGLILVAHDPAPFARFPGLTFEDWSVP